jgi:hypothetical protein
MGGRMGTKLERVEEKSADNPKMVFTSLYHLINEELLEQCHNEIDGNKATGVDSWQKSRVWGELTQESEGLTWDGFEEMPKIFPLVRPRIYQNIYN